MLYGGAGLPLNLLLLPLLRTRVLPLLCRARPLGRRLLLGRAALQVGVGAVGDILHCCHALLRLALGCAACAELLGILTVLLRDLGNLPGQVYPSLQHQALEFTDLVLVTIHL